MFWCGFQTAALTFLTYNTSRELWNYVSRKDVSLNIYIYLCILDESIIYFASKYKLCCYGKFYCNNPSLESTLNEDMHIFHTEQLVPAVYWSQATKKYQFTYCRKMSASKVLPIVTEGFLPMHQAIDLLHIVLG